MKICHVSDLHGYFPSLPKDFDVLVCSGDFYKHNQRKPNYGPERRRAEVEFQTNWLRMKLPTIKEWLDGRPFVWCSGNHDFLNPCEILNEAGIEAIDLDKKVVEYKGLVWYGFPYVRYLIGEWNWEAEPQHWREESQNIVKRLKEAGKLDKLDVLVAHSPPEGVVDLLELDGRVGNPHVNPVIQFALQKPLPLYLCGHIHEAYGWEKKNNTLYVNSAIAGKNKPHLISFNNGDCEIIE